MTEPTLNPARNQMIHSTNARRIDPATLTESPGSFTVENGPTHTIKTPARETLLWQGRPDTAPYLNLKHLGTFLRGLFALALFLYIIARLQMGVSQYFDVQLIVFGLFFLSIPLDIARSVLNRRFSTYTLTTRHAQTTLTLPLFGTTTRRIPILPTTEITHHKHRFSTLSLSGPKHPWWTFRTNPPIFERIKDGEHVAALIAKAQREAA